MRRKLLRFWLVIVLISILYSYISEVYLRYEIRNKDAQIQELQNQLEVKQIQMVKVLEKISSLETNYNKLKEKRVLTEKDIKSLEKIVEAEASTEGILGKALVASVVLNRWSQAKDKTIHEIIIAPGQFQPVKNGKYYSAIPSEETKKAVEMSLWKDYSNGALYFMNPEISSRSSVRWFRNNLELSTQYKSHQFYK